MEFLERWFHCKTKISTNLQNVIVGAGYLRPGGDHEKEQHPKSAPACKTLCKCSVCQLSKACKRNTVKLRVFEHECIRPFSVGGPHGYKRYL